MRACPGCGGPLIGPHPPLLPGEFYYCQACEKGFDDKGECDLIILQNFDRTEG